jgi:hypothetical protein
VSLNRGLVQEFAGNALQPLALLLILLDASELEQLVRSVIVEAHGVDDGLDGLQPVIRRDPLDQRPTGAGCR